MQYKLLCTDIDGTLLNKDRELSESTIEQFHRVKGGCDIVLASSRMPEAMRHLQKELSVESSPLIAYNGGLVLAEGQVLNSTEVSYREVEHIVSLSENTEVHVSVYHNDEWYVPGMDYWANREANNTKVQPQVRSLTDTLSDYSRTNKGAHKVMCMGPADEIATIYNTLIEKYDDHLHVYRSKDTYLEIASKQISKKSAIETLLNHSYSNLTWEQIIAFGDNYNDIEMLEAVGMGVAVGNAKDEVLAIANHVTSGNKENGVALAMKHLML